MSELKNCKLSTGYRYHEDEDDTRHWDKTRVDTLIIEIPLPCGKAIYQIDITNELSKSLEAAQTLQK